MLLHSIQMNLHRTYHATCVNLIVVDNFLVIWTLFPTVWTWKWSNALIVSQHKLIRSYVFSCNNKQHNHNLLSRRCTKRNWTCTLLYDSFTVHRGNFSIKRDYFNKLLVMVHRHSQWCQPVSSAPFPTCVLMLNWSHSMQRKRVIEGTIFIT